MAHAELDGANEHCGSDMSCVQKTKSIVDVPLYS